MLSDSEIRDLWNALPEDGYGVIIKLLALTGQRHDEIGGLRWSEVDLAKAMISLPAERTKNNRRHDIPLSPAAVAILKHWLSRPHLGGREYVFGTGTRRGYQGWGDGKKRLDQQLRATGKPIPAWVVHDLRRTASTRMHEVLGIAPHIVEAVLNHVSGHRAGVAGVTTAPCTAPKKPKRLLGTLSILLP